MQLHILKDNLRKELADGQAPSVLAYLMTALSDDSDYFSDVYTQSGNLKNLENQQIGGRITSENLQVEKTKIDHALLLLIDNLTEDDFKKTNITELEKRIADLKLAPLGKIKLVDCDRDAPYADFKKAYKNILKSPFQYYFVTAQAADQPAHFAERVIYEIISNTLKGSDLAINFPRRICKITAVERVDFPELPFDDFGDLSDNQVLFRTHFAERMKRFNLEAASIEDLVSATSKRLPYRFFAFLFRIDFDEWGWTTELTEYLAWIIRTFKANSSNEPLMTFQFVFIISSAKTNVNENADIKAGIEEILMGHPDTIGRGANDVEKQPAVWLKNFTPVPTIDLTQWFLKLTNDQFQPQIRRIIKEATAGFEQPDPMNMADLEELFLAVYSVSQRI